MDMNLQEGSNSHAQVDVYHVEMLGAAGAGKQSLVSQFRTSDCINAYDGPGKVENKYKQTSTETILDVVGNKKDETLNIARENRILIMMMVVGLPHLGQT